MLSWLRKRTKSIMISVAIIFAASMFYGLGYQGLKGDFGKAPSKVLAKVNGTEIDANRYRQMLNRVAQSFGKEVGPQETAFVENFALAQAIDFTLMLNEAKRKVRVAGGEIDSTIDGLMRQQNIPSKKELETALKRMGLDMGKFRDLIKDDILVQKLSIKIREEVKLNPDDMREVKASHILLTSEVEAKIVLDKVKKGENFAALAKEYSKDPGSAKKGGELGFFAAGMMVPAFEKAAFSLRVGEVSGIVQTPFGFHIIKAVDSRVRKFPGEGKDIEQSALHEKQEKAFRTWYSEIRRLAKVEIINPEMLGNDLRFKGRIQEAIEAYKKAVALYPDNPFLNIFLGDSYSALGKKAEAISEYETAVKKEGGNPEFYIILGKAYEAIGNKDLASAEFKKASLIAGDNKILHEKLLKTFEGMKRNREAAVEKKEISRIEKKEKFEKEINRPKSLCHNPL